jgi:hypothetical protein
MEQRILFRVAKPKCKNHLHGYLTSNSHEFLSDDVFDRESQGSVDLSHHHPPNSLRDQCRPSVLVGCSREICKFDPALLRNPLDIEMEHSEFVPYLEDFQRVDQL